MTPGHCISCEARGRATLAARLTGRGAKRVALRRAEDLADTGATVRDLQRKPDCVPRVVVAVDAPV